MLLPGETREQIFGGVQEVERFLYIGDDRLSAFHDGHHGVGGAQVDSDDLAHCVTLLCAQALLGQTLVS